MDISHRAAAMNRKTAVRILIIIMLLGTAVSASAGKLEPLTEPPMPLSNPQTPEKIELGKKLFFDRRLSGDGTMSCASCHIPEQGFTDGMDLSLSYPTTRNWRNAPTLYDVAFLKTLFHDGRARNLEDQALFPLMSAFEMNQNLDYLEEELREVPDYVDAFQKVFGSEITREKIAMALAAFERTITSSEAPLDRFLKGDPAALSPEAKAGYDVFIGKGKCAECHFGAVLSDGRFHALNVPEDPAHQADPRIAITRRYVAKVSGFDGYRTLKEDPGRFLITKDRKDWKAFRTPTLREIARTGPYMHNGIFDTLEQVIEFFDRGGGPGNGELRPLHLREDERKSLETFMTEALTGPTTPFSYPKVP